MSRLVILPRHQQVLIEERRVDKIGALHLAGDAVEVHHYVLATGPDVQGLKAGDRVLVHAKAPTLLVSKTDKRVMVNDEDILGVVVGEEAPALVTL